MIKILGLGPGNYEALTLSTIETLKNCKNLYLRTYKHPTVEYLDQIGIKYKTYDEIYDSAESFDEVYESIAKDLIEKYKTSRDIVYAVPGHPLVAEKSVNILIELCNKNDIEYKIFPAVSFIDVIMERLNIDPIEGLKVVDAFDIDSQVYDRRLGTIITQVHNKLIASKVKIWLMKNYRDDLQIYFIRAAGVEEIESIRKIPLFELDRQEDIDYLTSFYIPKDLESRKDFNDLVQIMDKLRSENGCLWDKEQTHESLKKYLIEESYEVIEAIEAEDDDMMIEELGDLLLQIVFHASIGEDDEFFDIGDVINGICSKMIQRHPHVFGEETIDNSKDVLLKWDEIKKEEKGYKTYTEQLKHIAKCMPALMRADKVQQKASKAGFDWDRVEDAMDKVTEELFEVKDVYNGKNKAKIVDEVGDLIFSTVNIARLLDIEPEFALNFSIDKFIKRFEYVENRIIEKGKNLHNVSLKDIDLLWKDAKNNK